MNTFLLLFALLTVDVGSEAHRDQLGYGWSRNENSEGRSAAWIKRMEADVFIDLQTTTPLRLEIDAKAFLVKDKQQNVGIYLNGHYIGAQRCKQTTDYQTLSYILPAEHQVIGKNRIIVRLGYLARPKGDGRKVGIFVDQLRFSPTKE